VGLLAVLLAGSAAAASDEDRRACLTHNARVGAEIQDVGDHVMYRLTERNEQARRLCQAGEVAAAYSLMAEIRSDVRILRAERQLD
jgi:hypothetical protein